MGNFCAYHSNFGNNTLYASMPYTGTNLSACGVSTSPNNDFDNSVVFQSLDGFAACNSNGVTLASLRTLRILVNQAMGARSRVHPSMTAISPSQEIVCTPRA